MIMPDGSTVDTSIYKNQAQPQDPLKSLTQAAQTVRTMNYLKNSIGTPKAPTMPATAPATSSTGSYSEPGSDTMDRLGAGEPYGS
jgi:hypothetical protein